MEFVANFYDFKEKSLNYLDVTLSISKLCQKTNKKFIFQTQP